MSDISTWIEKNKALWARVYDEVIAPDFEAEWKKREESYAKDLNQKDEDQQTLFKHFENEVIKNSQLVAEVEQLKAQLNNVPNNNTPNPDAASEPEKAMASKSTEFTEETSRLVVQYDELKKRYHDLSQKMKYLERKNATVMQKNRDMKESVRAWQEYADRRSDKHKPRRETKIENEQLRLSAVRQGEDLRPQMLPSPGSTATGVTLLSLVDAGRSSSAPVGTVTSSEVGDRIVSLSPAPHGAQEFGEASSVRASVTPKPRDNTTADPRWQETRDDMPHLANHPNLQSKIPSSSQTTEDESAEQATRDRQLTTTAIDDDLPQFLSARCLKRKRGQPSRTEIYGERSSDGTPQQPFRIKNEPCSSPPIIHSLLRKETIDLDDLTPTVLQTPRHSKQSPAAHSNPTDTIRRNDAASAIFTSSIKQEDTRSEHLPKVSNIRIGDSTAEIRALSDPADRMESEGNILRHIDPNTVAGFYDDRPNKRTRQSSARYENQHDILSESGEEPPPIDEDVRKLAPKMARAKLNRKLHVSPGFQSPPRSGYHMRTLAGASVKMEQDSSPPTASSRTTHLQSTKTRPPNPQHGSTTHNTTTPNEPQWRLKSSHPRSSTRKSDVSPTTMYRRLRSKPITDLGVQDFKPNPAYNQGYSYAFSETVRKRGDRMCLPGCTNPQCCGSTFRTFAEAQAPLSSSQEEALLEDYLGEAYDNMSLTQMSSEERKELVLQARTKKMAKEAGKHREAYERRRTPPGFWRVDFPTTQERQDDREKSREQEKKLVQERWLEAQRKGGRWIFRDE